MFLKHVWSALTDVSLLLLSICSTTLDVTKQHELEHSVTVIMCNLEKIFFSAFFEAIEHLIIHLPYDTHIGVPVQYRSMYPIERFVRDFKKKLNKKAHVNASIVEEIDLFSPHYFESGVHCRRNRLSRNDGLTSNEDRIQRSTFSHLGRASGVSKKRWLNGSKRHIIETYILCNCEGVTPYE
ncbi:UNVERIFIED_CONTAM: hypothetical protein Sangu_1987000 [Sesamum angustifolium]|uniref:DUF4218 domain-containing protein n=1 Tax=Sesamum angustifolium TaxID=2727405 RepID=A0AAW2LJ86_9LAMI